MSNIKRFLKTNLAKQLAVVLIPLVVLIGLVAHYGVNVPVTDQYEMIPVFQKVDAGTLSFSDLWAQQNEHRIFFPRTIQVGLAFATDWDIRAEVISSLIVAMTGFTALFLIIRKSKLSETARLLVLGVAALWFFSPVQWENWLWGWQLEWFLCLSATLWAFYFLHILKPENRISKPLVAAVIGAFVATFSLGSGVLIWIVGLLVMALRGMKKQQFYYWTVLGAGSIILYYIDYTSPAGHPPLSLFIKRPQEFIEALLAYLGRPVSAEAFGAVLVGAMVVVVMAIVLYMLYKQKLLRENAVWIGISLYAVIAGTIAIASRLGFGPIVGLASRYTAFTVLLFVALTYLVIMLLTKRGFLFDKKITEKSILVVAALLMLPLIAGSYYNGLQGMKKRSAEYKEIYTCSRFAEPSQWCLYLIYFPSTEVAKQRLDYLKQKGWGGY